jgi:hypothetical protein
MSYRVFPFNINLETSSKQYLNRSFRTKAFFLKHSFFSLRFERVLSNQYLNKQDHTEVNITNVVCVVYVVFVSSNLSEIRN